MKHLGIDLGATDITVCGASEGLLCREEAAVAVEKSTGKVLAIGADARRLCEQKTQVGLKLLRPFADSVFTDPYTRRFLSKYIQAYKGTGGVRILLGIPCNYSELEEVALRELCAQAGAGDVALVYSPIPAMVGAGVPLGQAALLVNIGASHTDLMLVCRERIFYKSTVSSAGNTFDLAIANYIYEKHRIKVSLRTAEAVKRGIGTVWLGNDRKYMDVRGKDADGSFRTVRISSEEMFSALEEPTAAIMEAVCTAITKIPADCVHTVFDRGILLCGGGSTLDGLDKMIEGVTGVKARVVSDPLDTVWRGLSVMLGEMPAFLHPGQSNISREYMHYHTAKRKKMK